MLIGRAVVGKGENDIGLAFGRGPTLVALWARPGVASTAASEIDEMEIGSGDADEMLISAASS